MAWGCRRESAQRREAKNTSGVSLAKRQDGLALGRRCPPDDGAELPEDYGLPRHVDAGIGSGQKESCGSRKRKGGVKWVRPPLDLQRFLGQPLAINFSGFNRFPTPLD